MSSLKWSRRTGERITLKWVSRALPPLSQESVEQADEAEELVEVSEVNEVRDVNEGDLEVAMVL